MGDMIEAYKAFLQSKVVMADSLGFDIDDADINPILKPFQRACVCWAVRMGRAALFESFGLGKTLQQIEIVRLILEQLLRATGETGMGLIVIPLGVRQEFLRDAVLLATGDHPAITDEQRAELRRWQEGRPDRIPSLKFIRRIEECDGPGIYLTNYETVRDGKLDPRNFVVGSLDEAAILRGFGGTRTFREFMATFAGDRKTMNDRVLTDGVKYRFVATATPSPNEYIELLAYSAFLGVMDISNAKTRFFKRNSEKADQLTLHVHKEKEFWMWVASWGLFIQKPSDLCECSCHRENNSSVCDSVASSSNPGNQELSAMAHGVAGAIAGIKSSHDQATYCVGSSLAADVSDQSTAVRGQEPMRSGGECLTDAAGNPTKTGSIMEGEVSSFANAGTTSETSSQIWETRPLEQQSSVAKTTETTSLETAVGIPEKSKHATPGDLFSSHLMEEPNHSLHGQRNLASATPDFTADTNAGGQQKISSRTCCEKCRCDEGYDLPELDIHWHEIPADHTDAGFDFRGQGQLIKQQAIGVVDSAREKRESLPARIAKMMEIRAIDLDAHRIIWHDLEAERMAIEKAIPDVMSVYGSQDDDTKATRIIGFSEGEFRELAGKPVMLGSGCNFQRHCAWAIFLGIGFKFADFIQAVHRLHRFLQQKTVRIDLIYTEQEREVRRILEQKWQQHKDTVEQMTAIIKEFGLSSAAMADNLKRAMGVERIEVIGRNFRAINNDCVLEAANMPDNSIDLGLTSIPFSTQYEYSPNYSDFGHSDNNAHFFEQMDFLTPNLLRVLKPGRIFAIHVKDRIVPGGMTGLGFQTVYPFHARCIEHYTKHGFGYLGMKTIVTDVVRENNQTYRLGWSEQCKDGTKMGVGMPEYLLLFRKPPSDTSNSYADEPVTKGKPDCADADGNVIPWVRGGNEVIGTGYSRARWQVDAHGFARSSGNRLLTPDELETLDHDIIFRWFRDYHLHNIYDFEHHVRIGETIDSFHRLPTTFMLLQPPSWMDDVWTDVARMRTLNMIQAQKGQEQHLCPLPFDIVDRVIEQFSMPGETVFDPFGGIMSVPYRSILKGRKAIACELSSRYFMDGVQYCQAAEREMSMPSLFDSLEMPEAA